uniref:Putative thap domain protein n=1 Tax=Ixodes ricinus TaxID=34613 RepID=A0A0K8RCC4_IXORI
MRVCCVYSCWNRNLQQKSATFHRFPRSRPEIYQQWVINIGGGRRNWQPSGESVVCSDHFEEECFDRTGQTVRLRVDAIPTKNLEVSGKKRNLMGGGAVDSKDSLCGRDPPGPQTATTSWRRRPCHPSSVALRYS